METFSIILVMILVSLSVMYALNNKIDKAIYLILIATAIKIEMIWNEIIKILNT